MTAAQSKKKKYAPEQGDIVWLNFTPQAGHEQAGKRPALIVSSDEFHKRTNLIIACPITTRESDFPLHLALPQQCKTKGKVMCEQVRSLDPQARGITFVESTTDSFMDNVKTYLGTFLS